MSAFTIFWSSDRCNEMIAAGTVGKPITVMFGGPHSSQPSFSRAGVKLGDVIHPIRLHKGVVYILGAMVVNEILPFDVYVRRHPELYAGCTFDIPIGKPPGTHWLVRHPHLAYLAPTCTDEAVIAAAGGFPITLDVPIPPDELVNLRYRSQRSERALKHVVDGRLTSPVGVQGLYRLADASAAAVIRLLDGR